MSKFKPHSCQAQIDPHPANDLASSMASELKPIWDGGMVQAGPVLDEPSEPGSRASSKAKGRAPAKTKKPSSKTLSSSFTCWSRLPEPRMKK